MSHRIALFLVALAAVAPSAWRLLARNDSAFAPCRREGRGEGDATWAGCATAPGPRRGLSGPEALLLGQPVDVNAAAPGDLAAVPGIGPALAREVVADRARRGRFASVDALLRVRGVGPARLALARPHLVARE